MTIWSGMRAKRILNPATSECSRYVKSKLGSTPGLHKLVAATECGHLLQA
jgi:hypothetical protein